MVVRLPVQGSRMVRVMATSYGTTMPQRKIPGCALQHIGLQPCGAAATGPVGTRLISWRSTDIQPSWWDLEPITAEIRTMRITLAALTAAAVLGSGEASASPALTSAMLSEGNSALVE